MTPKILLCPDDCPIPTKQWLDSRVFRRDFHRIRVPNVDWDNKVDSSLTMNSCEKNTTVTDVSHSLMQKCAPKCPHLKPVSNMFWKIQKSHKLQDKTLSKTH